MLSAKPVLRAADIDVKEKGGALSSKNLQSSIGVSKHRIDTIEWEQIERSVIIKKNKQGKGKRG